MLLFNGWCGFQFVKYEWSADDDFVSLYPIAVKPKLKEIGKYQVREGMQVSL